MFLGGTGNDTIAASMAGANIGIMGNFDATNSIETISAAGFANVKVWGDDNGNRLDFSNTNLVGIESVNGGDGNDTITGGGWADPKLNGGNGDDRFFIDASALLIPATDIVGGAGSDRVSLSGASPLSIADLVGSMTQIERIDFGAPGVAANLLGFTGADALAILGRSASTGNVLTLDLDLGGDDSFSAVSNASHTANDLGSGMFQFIDNATSQEVARISVI